MTTSFFPAKLLGCYGDGDAIFTDELKARNNIAETYIKGLSSNMIVMPRLISGAASTWVQFTIEVEKPDELAAHLSEEVYPQPDITRDHKYYF